MAATLTNEQLIAELEQRVAGLYRMNAELAAQVDRQGKVVDAARTWAYEPKSESADNRLISAVTQYDTAMARLAKGGTG